MARSTNKPKAGAKAPKSKPAPKAKAKPKPATAETAPPPSQQSRKVISGNDLTKLLKTCKSLKGQSDTIIGSLREEIGNAVEKRHLNKEVFALIRKLDRKEPEALRLYIDDLEHYLDVSGLMDRADAVGTLPLGARDEGDNDGEGDDAAETQPGAGAPPTDIVSRPQSFTGQAPGGTVHMLPAQRSANGKN